MSLKTSALAVFVVALSVSPNPSLAETRTAILAGGCFWCVEKDFDHVPGVIGTTSGYSGGTTENPTYKTYVAGGHREVVKIDYDDAKISYATLLDVYWHSVDPTDAGGEFCDRGHAYSTAIYASGKADLATATTSKAEIAKALGKPIATEILPATAFWPAEDYHQGYYKKNPVRYKYYRYSCGRDERIDALWGADAHKGIEGY